MKFKRSVQIGISLLCCILLVSTGTAAAEDKLEISEAVNLVLEENIELKIARLELENAKLDYQKSQAENLATESQSSKLEAELSLLQARDAYYNNQAQLLQEVLNKYTTALLAQKNVIVKQKKTELEDLRLDKVKQKLEQGHVNDLEVIEQTNDYREAEMNLVEAKDDYQEAIRELKTLINASKTTKLELQNLELNSRWQISQNQVVETGFENNLELQVQAKNIKVLKQNLTKNKQASTPSLDLKKAENKLKMARLTQENLKKDLENQLYAAYQDFTQVKDRLDLRKNNLEASRANYNQLTKKHQQGLASQEELLAAEEQLITAEYNYQQAVVNYYKEQLELKVAMQLEVEGLIDDWD